MNTRIKTLLGIVLTIFVVFLAVASVWLAFTFDNSFVVENKQDIVANAQAINGVDYPDFDSSELVFSFETSFFNSQNKFIYTSFDDDVSILPLYSNCIYEIDIYSDNYYLWGFFVPCNNLPPLSVSSHEYEVIGSFVALNDYTDYPDIYSCVVGFSDVNGYIFAFPYYDALDGMDSEPNFIVDISLVYTYNSVSVDNIGSIIASGMTFGLDGITSSVSIAFDSVFLDNDGNLSNYSIFVFWALGVSVALGFFKYILDWILSLGSRK